MKINFLNVGYGDSILLETENREKRFRMLIDGGTAVREHYSVNPCRIRVSDYLAARSVEMIDILVITHLHEDHVAGLRDVVEKVPIGELWCNFLPDEGMSMEPIELDTSAPEGAARLSSALSLFGEILTRLRRGGTRIVEKSRTQLGLQLFPGVIADIFCEAAGELRMQRDLIRRIRSGSSPAELVESLSRLDSFVNQTSLVLRIKSGGKAVLLGGDVGSDFWVPLLERGQDISADILKMPHHGHADAASPEFARAVNPGWVVVSVSNDRSDGCPNPEALEIFSASAFESGKPVRFLFTDAVKISSFAEGSEAHRAVILTWKGSGSEIMVHRVMRE